MNASGIMTMEIGEATYVSILYFFNYALKYESLWIVNVSRNRNNRWYCDNTTTNGGIGKKAK